MLQNAIEYFLISPVHAEFLDYHCYNSVTFAAHCTTMAAAATVAATAAAAATGPRGGGGRKYKQQ